MKSLLAWLRRDLMVKATSLGLTLILFYFARDERVEQRTFRVEVQASDVVGDIVLIEDPDPVELVVRGSARALAQINPVELQVLRVGPVRADTRRWPIGPGSFDLPAGLEVVSVSPSSVRLETERLVEVVLPIRPNFRGQVAEGHEVLRVSTEPAQLPVRMPESYVGTVDELTTESIDLTGLVRTIARPVRLSVLRRFLAYPTEQEIVVTVEVGVTERVRLLGEVPIVVVGEAGRCEVVNDAAQVSLRGPALLIDPIDDATVFASIDCAALAAQGAGEYAAPLALQNVPGSVEATLLPSVVRVTVRDPAPPEAPAGGSGAVAPRDPPEAPSPPAPDPSPPTPDAP
jgi:hypothetical protein